MTPAPIDIPGWRKAMEGVTPGPWRPSRFGFQIVSDYPEPAWQSVVELTTIARSEPNAEREMLTQQAVANWLARCSPSAITALLDALEASMAREAELRADIAKLQDPIVVHMNMLRGGIAKLSREQIEHIHPEIAEVRAALRDHVEAFRPFTNRPVGGEGSPARLEQEHQIAAHTRARTALKDHPNDR